VRDPAGDLVATGMAHHYPPAFGWISMILVSRHYRRRGLATAGLHHATRHLCAQGLVPMLDATPLGRTVHAPLGFCEVDAIWRWRRGDMAPDGAQLSGPAGGIATGLAALDTRAFDADRSGLFRDILCRKQSLVVDSADGTAPARAGRMASHVGPICATDGAAAVRVLLRITGGLTGPVIVDIPDRRCRRCDNAGLCPRTGVHAHGARSDHCFRRPTRVSAIAGPDLG